MWLPAGIMGTAPVGFGHEAVPLAEPAMWVPMVLMAAPSLIVVAPCGLPLALGSRRLWRLGYRRHLFGRGQYPLFAWSEGSSAAG